MKIQCREFFESPLVALTSEKANIFKKVLSATVVGIFTLFSFGGYALFAHRYFENRKVENLSKESFDAITKNENDKFKSIIDKMPGLKLKYPDFLKSAAKKGNFEIIQYLIEKNTDVDADTKGTTPLFICLEAMPPRYEIINYLVQKGAKLTLPAPHGYGSALSYILNSWETNPIEAQKTVNLMLEKGAKLTKKDKEKILHSEVLNSLPAELKQKLNLS